jgi:hypothetical protein
MSLWSGEQYEAFLQFAIELGKEVRNMPDSEASAVTSS